MHTFPRKISWRSSSDECEYEEETNVVYGMFVHIFYHTGRNPFVRYSMNVFIFIHEYLNAYKYPRHKSIVSVTILMVNLDQIIFTPHLFLDVLTKWLFFHIENCISLLFVPQMVKIYPKDHLLQVEIWVSVDWKIIFSFSKYRASVNNLKSILSSRNWKSDITASLKHNFTVKLYAMKLC